MVALNFPTSPSIGDTYTANGKTWEWDGTSWKTANLTTADMVGNTPAGNIDAVNVQDALDELDSEKQPIDADLTAIAALAGTSGLLKKTAADTWSLDTTSYLASGGALGTPSSGTLTNTTGLPIVDGTTGTLSVGRGGSGTATQFTAGSVVFAGASGVYSQDNANLFWDDTNNRLGIGTASPAARLDVRGTNALFGDNSTDATAKTARLCVPHYTNAELPAAFFNAASQSTITNLSIGGGSGSFNAATQIQFFTAANTTTLTGSERVRIDSSGNVGIGTSSFGTSAATVLAIATGTAPTTGPVDTIQIFSTDLSAGNTMLSLRTEGTPVNANTTAAATHRIAIRVNGTVYYLLANTAA